jgi:hypothetical protein
MRLRRLPCFHVLLWALVLLLSGWALLANGPWWAEAFPAIEAEWARPAPARGPSIGDRKPAVADPWARGPSGSLLDAGYAPGQQRPGLLP